jgi:hypothetical protein
MANRSLAGIVEALSLSAAECFLLLRLLNGHPESITSRQLELIPIQSFDAQAIPPRADNSPIPSCVLAYLRRQLYLCQP